MKPILFNTEMVRAILGDRKTVTRRLMKPQPYSEKTDGPLFWCWKDCQWADGGQGFPKSGIKVHAPYKPGDVLYVRETWAYGAGKISKDNIIYKADRVNDISRILADVEGRWRASIHMPKEAARIFLRVTGVRVERLQEINDNDALKEGVPEDSDYPIPSVYCAKCHGEGILGALHPVSLGYMEVDCEECNTPVKRFSHLWDSTIKKTDLPRYGWEANPWVWVIEFERVERDRENYEQYKD